MPRIVVDARETLLASLPTGGTGMEIGVWKGDFSARILARTNPKRLHLVDPWKAAEGERYDKAWYGLNKTTQAQMNAIHESVVKRFAESEAVVIHRKTAMEFLPDVADKSLDFVYVDGDHTYESVLSDLNAAFEKVRVGGYICGDDYSLGQWWQDGVVKALHQFLASHLVAIEFLLGSQFMVRRLRGRDGA